MNYEQYLELFDNIFKNDPPPLPYDKPGYLDYTRLNFTRMNRWMKTLELDESLVQVIKNIKEPQHWIVIVEPWCGDVAHILPVIIKLVDENALISYDLQQRDKEPFLINSYLTNNTKGIPKLIVRDANNKDFFNWGPRPAGAQKLMNELAASKADLDAVKIKLQNWYNKDRGESVQQELKTLFCQSLLQTSLQ